MEVLVRSSDSEQVWGQTAATMAGALAKLRG